MRPLTAPSFERSFSISFHPVKINNTTVLSPLNGPFVRMPKILRDLHPEWTLLDTDTVTVVLNNIYAHPQRGPYEGWKLWKLCQDNGPHPETKSVTFFGKETVERKYIPITNRNEVIDHLDLKWLAIPGLPTVMIYHPF